MKDLKKTDLHLFVSLFPKKMMDGGVGSIQVCTSVSSFILPGDTHGFLEHSEDTSSASSAAAQASAGCVIIFGDSLFIRQSSSGSSSLSSALEGCLN